MKQRNDILVYVLAFTIVVLSTCLFWATRKKKNCFYSKYNTVCNVKINKKNLKCTFFYGRFDGCELI